MEHDLKYIENGTDLNKKNTRYLSLLITIKKFHGLFSELTDNISFLSQENSGKKYYKENVITPQISTVLNQIMNEKLSENVKNLYLKGKIFELLGMYFNESNDLNIEQCPFLADEKNVVKIKMAKEIIIKNTSILLFPMAPHIASEVYENYFGEDLIKITWPLVDTENLKDVELLFLSSS